MMELFSLEFWIILLFFINFVLVIFLFLFVKRVNGIVLSGIHQDYNDNKQKDMNHVSGSAVDIIEMLEPLVKDSKELTTVFDRQIKEKKGLIKALNDALDSRIISINLLLSRADALQKKLEERKNKFNLDPSLNGVLDQQNQIIKMYDQDLDIDSIAQKLSIPKGEVQLVIDLKKKLIKMEQKSR